MYAQVEKPKENKSMAVANSVTQRKSNVKKNFGFVDNREKVKPARIIPRSMVLQRLVIGIDKAKELSKGGTIWNATHRMFAASIEQGNEKPNVTAPTFLHGKDAEQSNTLFTETTGHALPIVQNEQITIVAHGSQPWKLLGQEIHPTLGGKSPGNLAQIIGASIPNNYSGSIYLDGCNTGMRRVPGAVGTSFIELFGNALLALKPGSNPVITGNVGTAVTINGGEERVEVPKKLVPTQPQDYPGIMEKHDRGWYVDGSTFGRCTYVPNGQTWHSPNSLWD